MEETLFLALMTLIAAGYLLALAGLLPLAGPCVWILNLLGGGWAVYVFAIKKSFPVSNLLQGSVIFLAMALLYWWLCRGCAFTDWDDFSHWGKSVKWMYYMDELYTSPASTDGFKSYPPATAVLQDLILKAGGFPFREDIVLYANALLSAGLLTLPFRAVDFHERPLRGAGMVVLLAVLPGLVYPSYFFRASVDGLLGLFTGILVISSFLPGRSGASDWVEALGCFVLALVKNSGTGLAVMAALVLMLTRLHRKKRASALFPLAAVLAAKLSWSIHLSWMGAGERWQWPGGLTGGVFSLLTGRADEYRYTVLQKFTDTIFRQGNYGPGQMIPFAVLPLGLIAFGALALLSCPKETRRPAAGRIIGLTVTALGMTAVFVLSLLYSYLYLFSSMEAMYLASAYRYLDTCTMLLLVTAVILACVCSGSRGAFPAVLPAVLALVSVWIFPAGSILDTVRNAPLHAAQTQNDRVLSRHAAERIQALGEETPRLQLITADDSGSAALRIDYELLPVRLPEQATILMADNKLEEPWVREISAGDWSRELAQQFDYVYIYCPEDQFVTDYCAVFEEDRQIVADRMFRVIVQPDGTAKLRCLDS